LDLELLSTEETGKTGKTRLGKLVETMSISELIKLREILDEGGEKATWVMKGLVRNDWIYPEMVTKTIKGSKRRIIVLLNIEIVKQILTNNKRGTKALYLNEQI